MSASPTARARRRGAFTLLEVVLAVALVVLLSGVVYLIYDHALGVRATLHRQATTALAQRRILDMMTADLTSALPFSTLQMGLEGQTDSLQFARTMLPSRAVFAAEPFGGGLGAPGGSGEGQDRPVVEPQADVELVGYRLRLEEDEEGQMQVVGLERTTQRTVLATTAEEGQEIQAVLLSEAVKFLRVQYWDGQAWVESWSGRSLPAAVRIDLGLEPLGEEESPEEYPHETMWRVIALPTGGTPQPAARPAGTGAEAGR